ncbi:MAG: acyl carrier protein [Hydrogenophaga sp. SCN 70-13]|jgi:acyl carrier protein|uniref:acyl carrier protein n=1 Tax=unclassified Hydrogenophaga TaxID=2610897 RepID=UPI00086A320A|nr:MULTISPECIES: acyl carrier protein [unclassified Hydrogenophaga]MBN9370549.1 acyl carrier protein [Hydrogenophaga sp.]ODT32569.1 MAG: acyl carrier protein [Hydrogenophaga sp. SCN 70-13]OJV56751.1 MAG: acyl carrier protein [Hydrogenophaga sp. 70-12]
MSTIKAEVRRYIEENLLLGAGAVSPGDDESFLEHQVLDSTGFLELVAHLEATYGITIGDEEMVPENLDSLNAIEAFVRSKQEAAA